MSDKFLYWVDAEFTILHIGIYVLIGLELDTTLGWAICGVLIAISVVYMTRRVAALPKDYLKVKEK